MLQNMLSLWPPSEKAEVFALPPPCTTEFITSFGRKYAYIETL